MSDFLDTMWQLGFEEGKELQSRKIAKKLYAKHHSVEDIAYALERDKEQIEEWLELVKV